MANTITACYSVQGAPSCTAMLLKPILHSKSIELVPRLWSARNEGMDPKASVPAMQLQRAALVMTRRKTVMGAGFTRIEEKNLV